MAKANIDNATLRLYVCTQRPGRPDSGKRLITSRPLSTNHRLVPSTSNRRRRRESFSVIVSVIRRRSSPCRSSWVVSRLLWLEKNRERDCSEPERTHTHCDTNWVSQKGLTLLTCAHEVKWKKSSDVTHVQRVHVQTSLSKIRLFSVSFSASSWLCFRVVSATSVCALAFEEDSKRP